MKRLSFFMLSLCALFCSSAYAQPTASSAPTDAGWASDTVWYYIKNAKGNYVSSASSKTDGIYMADKSTKPTGDEAAMWCLVGDKTNGYKFYNKASGTSKVLGFQKAETSVCNMVETSSTDVATTFSLVEATYYNKAQSTTDFFCIKWNDGTDDYYWTQNGGSTNKDYLNFWKSPGALYGWGETADNGKGDEGSSFKFEDATIYEVTYKYQVDGVTCLTAQAPVLRGTTVTVPAPSNSFLKLKDASQTATVTAATTINVPCTVTFTVSTDFDNATWYYIKHHKDEFSWYWHKSTSDYSVAVDKPASSMDGTGYGDEYLWCIMGDAANGYKFYNKAAGNSYTLSRANDTGTAAALSTDGTNNAFKVKICQAADVSGYAFYLDESSVIYLNAQSGSIKGWADADNGSTIRFIEAVEFTAERVLDWAASYQRPTLPDGAIYSHNSYLDDTNLATYQAAYNTLKTTKTQENINALVALNTEVSKGTTVAAEVEVGAYYRLKCTKPKNQSANGDYCYLSWDSRNPTGYPATVLPDNVSSSAETIWTFEKDGNYYHLKNLNAGKYIPTISNSGKRLAFVDEGSAGDIIVEEFSSSPGHFMLKASNYTTDNHCALFCENDATDHGLRVWDTSTNDGADWYIIKATELDVTLNTVNDASYASLYLPFAVSAPEGTTIYTGKINDEKNLLKMSSQDVAPAKTGIVLVNDNSATSVTMYITTTDATVAANDLSGTLLPITSDLSNYLIFSKGNTSGAIGFYTPSSSLSTIRANKAYILASAVSAASGVMKMDFGGEVTDITAVDASAPTTSGAIYDLAGRRVLTPVKGGIYIQNGRKVMK